MIINVQVKGMEAVNRMNNQILKLPKTINDVGYEFCRKVQRNMWITLLNHGSIWRGKLMDNIKVARKRDGAVVTMNKEGVYLDRMKPHYVSLKRGRLITQWAKEKGNPTVQAAAAYGGAILVRPHPFITESISKAYTDLNRMLKDRVDRTVRRAG